MNTNEYTQTRADANLLVLIIKPLKCEIIQLFDCFTNLTSLQGTCAKCHAHVYINTNLWRRLCSCRDDNLLNNIKEGLEELCN